MTFIRVRMTGYLYSIIRAFSFLVGTILHEYQFLLCILEINTLKYQIIYFQLIIFITN